MKTKPTKTRNLEESRKAILQVAFLEVLAKGFQGVSIDDIVSKTPYTKGAFYNHFPTKLDLGYALVGEVISPMILERWIEPLKKYENPIEGIKAQLQSNIGGADMKLLRLGCPLNNLVQEMSPIDKGFRVRLQSALNLWINEMDTQLKRGKQNGYLRKNIKTIDAAKFIIMAHEGFYGLIKGVGDEGLFKSLKNSMAAYFESIEADLN